MVWEKLQDSAKKKIECGRLEMRVKNAFNQIIAQKFRVKNLPEVPE
jgi:hypothetical protein